MLVVNLFAGPGAGKSTTAAGVFYNLKTKGISCEYVEEEAKQLTWESRMRTLGCQPYVFGKQMRNIWRLEGQVDVVVTDSPILLSMIYADKKIWPESFFTYVLDQFNLFNNMNFFIRRTKPYSTAGRNQTLDEAKALDEKILGLLVDKSVNHDILVADFNLVGKVVKRIERKLSEKKG